MFLLQKLSGCLNKWLVGRVDTIQTVVLLLVLITIESELKASVGERLVVVMFFHLSGEQFPLLFHISQQYMSFDYSGMMCGVGF